MNFGDKLGDQYKLSCEVYGTYPDAKLWNQFKNGEILLNLPEINSIELETVCHAISQPLTPIMIEIKSTLSSKDLKKNSDIEKRINSILRSLCTTLKVSKTLLALKFINIFVPMSSVSLFAQGLSLTGRLRSLIFVGCNFEKNSFERICLSIKNSTSISLLTFDNCHINRKHLKMICCLLMHQSLNKTSLLWKHTLRTHCPDKEKVSGLTHLVLNNNPLIEDNGMKMLVTVLADDVWLKGIELENCGISSASMDEIVSLLKHNKTLEYLSLNKNPFFDSDSLSKIEKLLCTKSSYKPPPLFKRYDACKEQISLAGNQKIYREIDFEETLRSKVEIHEELKKINLGMPWRIMSRIIERNERLPVGTLAYILEELNKSRPKKKTKKKFGVSNLGISIQNIRNVIKFYKSQWKCESKKRLLAEKRMRHLQKKLDHYKELLSDSYVVDDETFGHIEQCFYNFHKFLEKLKNVGCVELKDVDEKLSEKSLSIYSFSLVDRKKVHKVNSVKKENTSFEIGESSKDIHKLKEKVKRTRSRNSQKSSLSSKENVKENSSSIVKLENEYSLEDNGNNYSSSNSYSTEFEASEHVSSNMEEKYHEGEINEKDSSSENVSKSSLHKNDKINSNSQTTSSNSKGNSNFKVTDHYYDEQLINSKLDLKKVKKSKGGRGDHSDYSYQSHISNHYTNLNEVDSSTGKYVLHDHCSSSSKNSADVSHYSEENQNKSKQESNSDLENSFRLNSIHLASDLNEAYHTATDDDKINKIISDSTSTRKAFCLNNKKESKSSSSVSNGNGKTNGSEIYSEKKSPL